MSVSIHEGLAKHQAGDFAGAAKAYASVATGTPEYAQAVYLSGIAAQDMGDHPRAIAFLEQAQQLSPKQALIPFQLALSHNVLGTLTQALTCYRQALALDPQYVQALCNLGNLLKRTGDFAEAIHCYRRALTLAPQAAQIHYNLGVLYQELFKPEPAIECFRQAVRLEPNYAAAYNNLGVVLSEAGQLGESIACYKKAQKLDPHFAEAFYNLHAVLLTPEDLAPAIRCLEQAYKIAPLNDNYRFFLGMLHAHSGQLERSRKYLDTPSDDSLFNADIDAWRYLQTLNTSAAIITGIAAQTFKYAMTCAPAEGLVLEFGVFNGKSIRQLAKLAKGPVHGFDSFEGIPESWNDEASGSYSAQGELPEVPSNVTLHPGWFEDSIPEFKKSHGAPIRLMNIDCDLYSSTKTVLDLLAPQVVSGTVIIFDEYIGNLSWLEDEHKAFIEAAQKNSWSYEVLCFSFVTKQVAFRIL